MKDGSVSVRHVKLSGVTRENIHKFLNCLSIAFRDDQVISNRNIEVFLICAYLFYYFIELQAYKDYNDENDENDEDGFLVNIFDEFIQIVFVVYAEEKNEERDILYLVRKIEIESHENLDALIRAKNGREGLKRIRMNVHPE